MERIDIAKHELMKIGYADRAGTAELGEHAADGLNGETQIIRHILARHGDFHCVAFFGAQTFL